MRQWLKFSSEKVKEIPTPELKSGISQRKAILIPKDVFEELNKFRKQNHLTWKEVLRQRKEAFRIEKEVADNFSDLLYWFNKKMKTPLASELLQRQREMSVLFLKPETKKLLREGAASLRKSPDEIIDELVKERFTQEGGSEE